MTDVEFTGFPDGTYRFLRGVARNNSKAWFEAHRTDYERYYVEPAKAFVTRLGPRLQKISPTVKFEAKVNGSLFRINRDVRFARDKSPYKTHLDLWFWEGDHRGWDSPGFFFRMFGDKLILGAGMHRFEKTQLEAYRRAVLDRRQGAALEAAIAKVKRAGGRYELGGATRKQVPRGLDAGHPRAPLLLHEGLWASFEGKLPAEARSEAFVDFCAAHYRAVFPLSRWLSTLSSVR
jgi:uncharacterized protein (TIGR02453 family)